ncbi:HEAT repeat domain-containing protein [Hyalangium versicolor]|uniref:HEAT repeat domain-containing protein n=1 Tax=Hyalangium versicolor TaxID=2861190 RepID=UPI001CCA3CE1|nr:hypothetical protein [Hyalangium versicolor]
MPQPGKTVSPEEATAEVGHALTKLLNAHRFYAEGHASLVEFQQKLLEAIQQHHSLVGPVVLHVRSTTVLLGELPLLEAQSAKDSSTRPLFLEGVQQILFQQGLELPELRDFISLWNRALQRALPPEYDFYTTFWERGFEDIELVVAEVPAQDNGEESALDLQALADREDQLFEQLTKKQVAGAGRRLAAGHDEFLSRLEAEVLTPLKPQDLERPPTPAGFSGVSPEELATLRTSLERPTESLSERSLMTFWSLLAVCTREEQPLLTGWMEELLIGLISQGRWDRILLLLQAMTRDARSGGTRTADLYAIGRLLLSEKGRFALVEASTKPEEFVHVQKLLDTLPRDALLSCVDLLLEVKSPEARGTLAKLLWRRGVPLQSLATRAAALTKEDLDWVQSLREQVPNMQPLTAALLAHPQPVVRLAMMARLTEREVLLYRSVLLQSLSDAASTVRQGALTVLVKHHIEAAVGPLVNRLQVPMDTQELKTVLMALAELGGPAAAAALRSFFEREKNTDIKAHCARCIGVLGDPRARPLLEAEARRLFAPRSLRDACKEALSRLAPVG